ncbi:polyprenyl synthetase [Listeria weihenstephanensis FSL R9-0317]|uniref:Heptaprenyl diphosphate synthase n=1 Tax=Listeria weihenstephanensis TaxID=1006155 RepID=A0A1S7FR01_9LIST|nr:polyprenyl synthetase family protein [Listeria weihenstephanensis]AQY49881.1 heptaprenyl diphosphate synthase [Listeria weihenstephanensis]EUJ39786.1 polyprenyl synthetase [Listeria weihenstephanensis FSL R9-0317]
MQLHPMWDAYPNLQTDLKDVLTTIEKSIQIRDKQVEKNVKDLIHAGGKLLRPAYALLAAQIGPDRDRDRAIAVAGALEVLHMATLIHDDVVDDAPTRRGVPTIHSKYGRNYAVYTGDYLFCICFKILSSHANSVENIEFNSKNIEKILMGELDQMRMRYDINVTVRQYLSRISGKTAQLFALSTFSGASQSKATRFQVRNAWNIGHYLGMAFQIIDDVLDYTSSNDGLGKPVLNDVKQGVYTLPLIYAMQKHQSEFQPLLEKGLEMTDADLEQLLTLIAKYNGVEQAFALADKYTKKALREIKKLPQGAYRDQMYELTSSILKRNI